METIFSKIIDRKITADIIYQDAFITAFRDINPKAPKHILIVTNLVIPTINDITVEHESILGKLFFVAVKIAKLEGISEDGYRLIVNCNRNGGQEIYHLHMHLLGGKPLGPMIVK